MFYELGVITQVTKNISFRYIRYVKFHQLRQLQHYNIIITYNKYIFFNSLLIVIKRVKLYFYVKIKYCYLKTFNFIYFSYKIVFSISTNVWTVQRMRSIYCLKRAF